eukprot:scaffold5931_cov410-Prasinococcus_capsulatus_cf.AAC.2
MIGQSSRRPRTPPKPRCPLRLRPPIPSPRVTMVKEPPETVARDQARRILQWSSAVPHCCEPSCIEGTRREPPRGRPASDLRPLSSTDAPTLRTPRGLPVGAPLRAYQLSSESRRGGTIRNVTALMAPPTLQPFDEIDISCVPRSCQILRKSVPSGVVVKRPTAAPGLLQRGKHEWSAIDRSEPKSGHYLDLFVVLSAHIEMRRLPHIRSRPQPFLLSRSWLRSVRVASTTTTGATCIVFIRVRRRVRRIGGRGGGRYGKGGGRDQNGHGSVSPVRGQR